MTAINGETMLTGAQVMAIVPTTDLTRAKAFYGETLGLVDANVPTPGPQVIYRCGNTLLEVYERPTAGEARHTLASKPEMLRVEHDPRHHDRSIQAA